MFLFLLSGCGGNESKQSENAGGVFRMAIDADISTEVPRLVTDYYTSTVLNQIYEGLVSLDPETLRIRAQIAKSYKVSPDGLTYEFKIRENVLFHPHRAFQSEEERVLTCDDILHSFEIACTKNELNLPSPAYTSVFQKTIRGAKAFHEGRAKKISGIKCSKNKITIHLISQDVNFLSKLASIDAAISSKKVFEAKGEKDMIGTGPFLFGEKKSGEQKTIVLNKNPDYYLKDDKGCNLPYLDQLEFIIEPAKVKQLAFFEAGKTDLILSLPSNGITSMLEGRIQDFNSVPPVFILRNNPLLLTNYYFFNMQDARFKDVRVRKAFNYAIDRSKITRDVLFGQAYEDGIYGVVPPISSSFKNYDFEGVREVSYSYDPEKARELLAEAGYANGEGFGNVTLKFNIGDIQSSVAEEFARQISETLHINVNIDGSSFEQNAKDGDYLKGDIFRTAWYADYCSPETFLHNFYGKLVPASLKEPSTINQSRYVNPVFDEYFEKGQHEKKVSNQLKYFNLAEKELMKDPPVIVLWYAGDNQLIYSKVRNLQGNPMNYFYFREVYIKQWTKEEYQNHIMK